MPAGVFGPPPVPGQNGGTDPYPAPWEPSPKKTPKAVAVAIAVGGCLVVAAAVFCMVAVGADVLARAADGFAQLRQEAIRPKTMTADQIRAILDTCRNDPDAFAHLALKASAERIHTLVPGCLILGTLMGELRAERLDICKYGVREGYLVERVLG